MCIRDSTHSDQLITDIADLFGRQSITIAIDLINKNNKWHIHKHGQIINENIFSYIKKVSEKRIGEIKITFVSNEGMKNGLEKQIIQEIQKKINIPIIFEGGLGSLDQIDEAIKCGVEGIALGTMIIFMDNNIFKIKQFIVNAGHKIRV